eukprot:3027406-Amphidinium_carterae.1
MDARDTMKGEAFMADIVAEMYGAIRAKNSLCSQIKTFWSTQPGTLCWQRMPWQSLKHIKFGIKGKCRSSEPVAVTFSNCHSFCVDGMFSGVACLEPKTMRAKLGRVEETTAYGEGFSWYCCFHVSAYVMPYDDDYAIMVLLHSLGQYLTHICTFYFAYVPDRGAQTLQLLLSQATTLMRKWCGEVTVLKTDIASAFAVVLGKDFRGFA